MTTRTIVGQIYKYLTKKLWNTDLYISMLKLMRQTVKVDHSNFEERCKIKWLKLLFVHLCCNWKKFYFENISILMNLTRRKFKWQGPSKVWSWMWCSKLSWFWTDDNSLGQRLKKNVALFANTRHSYRGQNVFLIKTDEIMNSFANTYCNAIYFIGMNILYWSKLFAKVLKIKIYFNGKFLALPVNIRLG